MTKSNQALAAAAIRKELKAAGIKASVTSEGYSMGDSVNISLVDASPETMKAVNSLCKKYQYGHFDGMNDIYEHSNSRNDIPQTKFVMIRNENSDATKQAIYDTIRTGWAGGEELPETYEAGRNIHFQGDYISALVWRMFCDSDSRYWNDKKAAA